MSQSETDKRRITILSSHTPDSTGGFFWAPTGEDSLVIKEYVRDVEYGYDHVTLAEIAVPSRWDRQEITEFIDTYLLDLIETRRIGKIIKAHDRWGTHPAVAATAGIVNITVSA